MRLLATGTIEITDVGVDLTVFPGQDNACGSRELIAFIGTCGEEENGATTLSVLKEGLAGAL